MSKFSFKKYIYNNEIENNCKRFPRPVNIKCLNSYSNPIIAFIWNTLRKFLISLKQIIQNIFKLFNMQGKFQ